MQKGSPRTKSPRRQPRRQPAGAGAGLQAALPNPLDPLFLLFFGLFLASTPVATLNVFGLGKDRAYWAVVNNYCFSIGMCGMYLYPLLSPLTMHRLGFQRRLHRATMNWIIFLSVFTEVAFQIPHSLLAGFFHRNRGSLFEWPFHAYGLSDDRWSNYHNGTGLAFEVDLINANDAGLGLLVGLALWRYLGTRTPDARIALVLATLFRDATLWRETVEYMLDHHKKGYAHSTRDALYRPHAIACLWLVNIIWLLGPMLTFVWAFLELRSLLPKRAEGSGSNGAGKRQD
jgi:hypothetical protein